MSACLKLPPVDWREIETRKLLATLAGTPCGAFDQTCEVALLRAGAGPSFARDDDATAALWEMGTDGSVIDEARQVRPAGHAIVVVLVGDEERGKFISVAFEKLRTLATGGVA